MSKLKTTAQNSKLFQFKIITKDKKTRARVGQIITPHGVIDTPAFVPVGTKATVKGLTPQDLKECGVQLLFGNTYHLHLRPGEDTVAEFGGLAKFMGWGGATISDSGGFQVFSLGQLSLSSRTSQICHAEFISASQPSRLRIKSAMTISDNNNEQPKLVNITDDGVKFRSHIDGSSHMFTPEKSIEIQKKLGADLILAFDECAPHPSTYEYTKIAMERTHRWALRSLVIHRCHPELVSGSKKPQKEIADQVRNDMEKKQWLYGIVQGGVYKDLREESAKFISNLSFDGIAIGGVAVGESKKEMRDALEWTVPFLPEEKPKHLLGIGEIDDIFDAVEWGMDTFDCVIPTRFGRYGIAFVSPPEGDIANKFRLQLGKTEYAKDSSPIDAHCGCYVCQNFTRAYIHHLFRAEELLGYRLVSYHNVYFLTHLVKDIRQAILDGRFEELKKEWVKV